MPSPFLCPRGDTFVYIEPPYHDSPHLTTDHPSISDHKKTKTKPQKSNSKSSRANPTSPTPTVPPTQSTPTRTNLARLSTTQTQHAHCPVVPAVQRSGPLFASPRVCTDARCCARSGKGARVRYSGGRRLGFVNAASALGCLGDLE